MQREAAPDSGPFKGVILYMENFYLKALALQCTGTSTNLHYNALALQHFCALATSTREPLLSGWRVTVHTGKRAYAAHTVTSPDTVSLLSDACKNGSSTWNECGQTVAGDTLEDTPQTFV